MFGFLYGSQPMMSNDDPIVHKINDCMHRITGAAVPGAYLVDTFPILKNLPDWAAKWKKEAKNWFRKDSDMFVEWLDRVRVDMVSCYTVLLAKVDYHRTRQ